MLIDGLQYSNWDRGIFEQMRAGGVDCVHVTIVYWETTIETIGRVTQWNRLRPGCWLSTIPACGLLLSPEASGGCSCGNWLETSIGFAPKK